VTDSFKLKSNPDPITINVTAVSGAFWVT
jgi:hypothetical protein